MAGRRYPRNRHARRTALRTAIGAFLAFGMAPLALPPTAQADDFGLADVLGDPFGGGWTGPADAAAAAQPSFEQLVYDPIHTAIEGWINSPLGHSIDGVLNDVSVKFLIGNGADGTAAHPDGGAGGMLFGDGGNGYDESGDAGVAGGAGGSASWFGNGGAGGAGGTGADGGDGGNGGYLFGIGGNGGAAGDGGAGLPALGGAGGLAGMVGSHGAVGQPGTLASGPPSGAPAALSPTGAWLTNSAGQAVLLHGLNDVYKIPPYEPSASGFGADDAAFLAANGFNAVRLGVIWEAVEPQPGVFNDAYLASIAQTVQTLQAHGIRVLLDMHQDGYSSVFGGEGAPPWAVQDGGLPNLKQFGFPLSEFINPALKHAFGAFWSNADGPNGTGLENSYAQMWEHVADYFKNDPGVIGYEIMNEPYALGPQLPAQTLLGVASSYFDPQVLTPFYNQVDSAIRAVDPNTPVFFEPNANFFGPTQLGTVDDPNTVFSYHAYCAAALPVVGCLPDPTSITENADKYAQAHDIPAFMTEFGASSNQATIAASMNAANQKLFSWTEWAYTGIGDVTTSASSDNEEALVYNPALPPTGDNVNAASLTTLAEPYPQVVSGTPGTWSFDSAGSGTFQFSYSTEKIDGDGSFPAGSQTTISVPKVEFPNGYSVNVTGGHVVSGPNATELVIASNGGATTINITVTGLPSS